MDIDAFPLPTLRSSPRPADDVSLDDIGDLRTDIGLAQSREHLRWRRVDTGLEGGLLAGELDEGCQPPREGS